MFKEGTRTQIRILGKIKGVKGGDPVIGRDGLLDKLYIMGPLQGFAAQGQCIGVTLEGIDGAAEFFIEGYTIMTVPCAQLKNLLYSIFLNIGEGVTIVHSLSRVARFKLSS